MQNWKIILQSKYVLIVLVIICAISFFRLFLFQANSCYTDNDKEITGYILKKKIDGDSLSIIIKAKEKIALSYKLKSLEEKEWYNANLNVGDEIKSKGYFYEISSPTIPNVFSYKEYLKNHSIISSFKANEIIVLKKGKHIYFIRRVLENRALKKKGKEYIMALLLGDSNNIDKKELKENGISHLFAISGMHITFLVLGLERLFAHQRKKDMVISIILILYSIIIGFSPSIIRAVAMYLVAKLNDKYNLNLSKKKQIIYILLIMLIINPLYIKDIGFLYSFIICYSLSYMQNDSSWLVQALKSSFICFMASLIISGINNYQIQVLSIIWNIIFIPYVTYLLFPICILTYIIPSFSFILTIIIKIFEFLSHICSTIKFGTLILPKVGIWLYLIYFILFILYLKRQKKQFLICCIIVIIIIKLIPYLDSGHYLFYLDVGQGDSMLYVSSHHKNAVLIDTGGEYHQKEDWQQKKEENYLINNMITFFHSIGVERITMILSHGDFDHMGEAINLVNNFKVEKVIFNCGEYNDLEKELIKVLDKKHIKYYSCIKELNIDKNKLYFLQTKEYDNENDNSNVIYTVLDGYKFMFMGDASSTTEKEILSKYNLPDIDVLKVGHHGSKTSSSKKFISDINPRYSVISVGKNNRYGHPNKEVLNTLDKSKIYRTDQDGSIMFKIKNNKLKIKTCSP